LSKLTKEVDKPHLSPNYDDTERDWIYGKGKADIEIRNS
jgi:hypothetical protein